MLLPVILHKRIYVLLTILVTFPMLIWGILDAYDIEQEVLKDKEIELAVIATTLKERLPYSYGEILRMENVQDASPEEKRQVLNRFLQPIVDKVSKKYPGYGLGFYSQDLYVLAVAPFDPNLLGKKTNRESRILHDAGVYQLVYLDKSVMHNDEPIVGVRSQFFENGNLTGTVWASYKSVDVGEKIRLTVFKNLFFIMMCWLIMITIIWWAFRKIDKSLKTLVAKIETGDDNPEKLNQFPQLIPVLKNLISLRARIESDYLEKEAAKEEMARLARLNLVSQMAAGLAHEMRNPLQVVMGYIQFMTPKAEEKMKSRFLLIMDELERMNQLISDFLTIARNKRVEKVVIQLNEIIQNVHILIYPDIVKNALNITLQLEENLPRIYADRKEIIQLILNLSRNAIEAMGSKGTLTIKTVKLFGKVQLIISDTGCGISREQLEKIFDPFYTTKEEGTGLGLSVCKGIVDRHDAQINVISEEGVGTTFIITFASHSSIE